MSPPVRMSCAASKRRTRMDKDRVDKARRAQITYRNRADELQFWIDACKTLGLTKGTVSLADILAP